MHQKRCSEENLDEEAVIAEFAQMYNDMYNKARWDEQDYAKREVVEYEEMVTANAQLEIASTFK